MHARTSDEIPEAQDESQPSSSVQSCNRRHKQDSMHRDSFSYTACFSSCVYVVDHSTYSSCLALPCFECGPHQEWGQLISFLCYLGLRKQPSLSRVTSTFYQKHKSSCTVQTISDITA